MFGDLDNLVVEDGEDEDREDASGEEGMEYLIDDASFDIILLMIAGHGGEKSSNMENLWKVENN